MVSFPQQQLLGSIDLVGETNRLSVDESSSLLSKRRLLVVRVMVLACGAWFASCLGEGGLFWPFFLYGFRTNSKVSYPGRRIPILDTDFPLV